VGGSILKIFKRLFSVTLLILLIVSLTSCTQQPTHSSINYTTSPSPTLVSPTVSPESIQPTVNDRSLSSLLSSGEIDGCFPGDTLTIVYKKVEATFNDSADIMLGLIDNDGNYVQKLAIQDNSDGLGCFAGAIFWNNADIKHIGNDIFATLHGDYCIIYDAKNNTSFKIDKSSLNTDPVFDGFHNGVVITSTSSSISNDIYIASVVIIYQDGTVTYTDISKELDNRLIFIHSISPGDMNVGIYSDGLFWAYGSFYDLDQNCMIDLSQYDIDNIPVFSDGESQIIINRNDKKWETTIDKQGTFLYEPKETP